MDHFNLYAFLPFGVLLGTAFITAIVCIWIGFTPGKTRRGARPRHVAQILQFPTPDPRQPLASTALRPLANPAVYARRKLAG